MSGSLNRALYRLTRIPAPADHRPLVEALSSWLVGTAVDALTSVLRREGEKKTVPSRRRRTITRAASVESQA